MRILHTADWHLGTRLSGFPRLSDQFAQIDRVLALCDEHAIDVMVIAGDVFDTADPDTLEHILRELQPRLEERLARGMSVLILPGNHDRESVFPILERAQRLGGQVAKGAARVIFRATPTIMRLPDRDGVEVQFLMLPYPTASAYLDGARPLKGAPEVRAQLAQAWRSKLQELGELAKARPGQPVVVVSHVLVRGTDIGTLYKLSEMEDIPVEPGDLPGYAYWALGHIHKPGPIGGREDARYSGALERLGLDEANHERGVVLVEIGPNGLAQPPVFQRLDACPFYRAEIEGQADMIGLAERFPDRERAYVQVELRYTPGTDNPLTMEQEIRKIFPRCYQLTRRPLGESVTAALPGANRDDVAGTARDFARDSIPDQAQRTRVLALLEELIQEVLP